LPGQSVSYSQQNIVFGNFPNAPAGSGSPPVDTTQSAFAKIQANFTALFGGSAFNSVSIDAFGAKGTGLVDDGPAFNAACASFNGAPGLVTITPSKRYLMATQPVMPPGIWVTTYGSTKGNFFSQDYATQTGALIIPPGTYLSGQYNSTKYYNSAQPRTTGALQMGDGCRVSNIMCVSSLFTNPTTVVQMQTAVFDPVLGMPAAGNAIQMDGDECTVEDVFLIGFLGGIVCTNEFQDVSGNPLGSAGNLPVLRNIWGDCANVFRFGANGSPRWFDGLHAGNFTRPQGVAAQISIGVTIASDGAGGTNLTLTTQLSGGSFGAISWPNAIIGQPVQGASITVGLFDSSNFSVTNTAAPSGYNMSRFTGTWFAQGGGAWCINLAGMPSTEWYRFGVTSTGTIGITTTAATPAYLAWTASTYRPGYSLEILNSNSIEIGDFSTGGNPVHIGGSSNLIYIKGFNYDTGHQDGPALLIDGASSVNSVNTGHIYSQTFGIVQNSTGRPNGCTYVADLAISSNNAPVVLLNNDLTLTGCSFGKGALASAVLATGPSAGQLTMTATRFPTNSNDGGTIGYVFNPSAPLPLIDKTCFGAVTTQPTQFGNSTTGTLANAQQILGLLPASPIAVQAGAPGSVAKAAVGPSASSGATLSINNAGTPVGTIVFPQSSVSGTFNVSAGFTIAADTLFTILGPGTADSALAGVSVTMLATW
jgi:hypothetical protein